MAKYKFLTLAISEGNPLKKDFYVRTYDLKSKNFVTLKLEKNEIILKSGEILWDIGYITYVDEITDSNIKYNKVYEKPQNPKLGDNKLGNLKGFLEVKSQEINEFLNNERKNYSILKINELMDIEVIDYGNKCYLNIIGAHVSNNGGKLKVLNKDYRWVNYWTWVYNKGYLDDRKNKYLQLLNKKERDLYALLYRHTFVRNNIQSRNFWIAGIHWL